ncbi:MAG: Radical SAM domain protein [candidate division CPR2 bacterium GW2011_GWC1_39_9]|uniref:Radical SAM domain protein n=1 Tax=candidate division CPR2 bacterium GW2011_GWC2_39_10 TaxID=1618345 RepID=A0A0G0LPY6_UNCC2|nr:MAG: Radical SAM domain protein [candidate division CPR2 bacterium GW2011_GWC2_39_10]KKR34680.1 MAG: Radical SAM domain protein [candidate division CPR2 bacterium GW2011_GWC1_39_9]
MLKRLTLIVKRPRLLILARNHLFSNALKIIKKYLGIWKNDVGSANLLESITLRICGVCNLDCKMCSHICNKQESKFLSLQTIKKFIDDLDTPWPYISITGGEPLLHPDLKKILETVKRDGRFVSLTTNGTLLEEKASILTSGRLDMLIVSVDGDRKTHDRIRNKPNTYDSTIAGLKTILGKKDRPIVFINCAISSENYQQLLKVRDMAVELGADGINYQQLWFLTDNIELVSRDQKSAPKTLKNINLVELWRNLQKLKRSKIPVNIFPNLNFFEIVQYYQTAENFKPRFTNKGTDRPWHHAIITSGGEIIQCNKYHMGNINDKPFWDIVNGSEYQIFRTELNSNGRCLPQCLRCCNYFRD